MKRLLFLFSLLTLTTAYDLRVKDKVISLPPVINNVFSSDFSIELDDNDIQFNTQQLFNDTQVYENENGHIQVRNGVIDGLVKIDGILSEVHCDTPYDCVVTKLKSGINNCVSRTVPPGEERRQLQTSLRRLERIKWNDCFPGSDKLHKHEFGIAITRNYYDNVGNEGIMDVINEFLSKTNYIFKYQFSVELVVTKVIVGKKSDSWNNEGCKKQVTGILDEIVNWKPNHDTGCWMALDDCPFNGIVGVAYVGTSCVTKHNKAVSNVRGRWITFAHEFGHLINAQHSFENGVGKTGGIMDYGSGIYKGDYQFNDLRRDEICRHFTRLKSNCPFFKESNSGPSPTPSPTSDPDSICGNGEQCGVIKKNPCLVKCRNEKGKCKIKVPLPDDTICENKKGKGICVDAICMKTTKGKAIISVYKVKKKELDDFDLPIFSNTLSEKLSDLYKKKSKDDLIDSFTFSSKNKKTEVVTIYSDFKPSTSGTYSFNVKCTSACRFEINGNIITHSEMDRVMPVKLDSKKTYKFRATILRLEKGKKDSLEVQMKLNGGYSTIKSGIEVNSPL